MPKVTLYHFNRYDIISDQTVRSKRPATAEAAKAYGGIVVPETAQEVDASCIDGNGFLNEAYQQGQKLAASLTDAIVAHLDARLPEVAARLLDAFQQRLNTIWDEPNHEPKAVALVEWKIFEEQLNTFPARMKEEAEQKLKDWLKLAETTGVRGEADQLMANRIGQAYVHIQESALALLAGVASQIS